MKLASNQLLQKLKQTDSLPTVCWVSGDEPLLVLEACDAYRACARRLGISQREIIDVGPRFDGSALIAESQSLSLFGDRKLIELRLQSKLTDAARKALVEYLTVASTDNSLLVISARIEASQSKAKWFSKVTEAGWWVPMWPIEHAQLPNWLAQRAKTVGLSFEPDALALLVNRIDGNLLAARQELDKLALLVNNELITVEMIMGGVADSARYTVFDLGSTLLSGDIARAMKILAGLRSEGAEPSVVLWLLTRELRVLVELSQAHAQGLGLGPVFKKLRIFDKHQAHYQSALKRAGFQHYQGLLLNCSAIDASIKGQSADDPWHLISQVAFGIVSTPVLTPHS